MGFRNKVKKNTPKVDLQSYNIMLVGGYKSGKTRAWKEITELFYPNNPEASLLLAFEAGYKTWELESYVDMHNYDWEFFRNEVVKGLVQEAKEGSETKVIGIDTADRCIDMASDWLIEQQNKKHGKTGGNKFKSLQDVTQNTDNNGYILLKDELRKQFDALKNAGYGLFELAWTKEKETETIDGLKYNTLTLNMSKTGKDIFHSQADLVCVLHDDVKVVDREGNELEENNKDKKNRDLASNFHSTETFMYFRPTNYISISGGRFVNLPEKEPYSAENFMRVFEEAVKGQLSKTDKNVDELKKEEVKEREESAKKYAEQEEAQDSIEELKQEITSEISRLQGLKKTNEIKDVFVELFSEPKGYQESNDAKSLKKALEHAKSIS